VKFHLLSEFSPEAQGKYANGLGPKGPQGRGGFKFRMLRMLLVWVGLAALFDGPAKRHDLLYLAGGTEKDREWVDLLFLGDCLREVTRLKLRRLRGWCARALAHLVFETAREFGEPQWSERPMPLTASQINFMAQGKDA